MHYNGGDYLSMLGLKLNHVSKRGHRSIHSVSVMLCFVVVTYQSTLSIRFRVTPLALGQLYDVVVPEKQH